MFAFSLHYMWKINMNLEKAKTAYCLYVQLRVKNGAVLKVYTTFVGKYDEPTKEMKVVTTQRFGRKV